MSSSDEKESPGATKNDKLRWSNKEVEKLIIFF